MPSKLRLCALTAFALTYVVAPALAVSIDCAPLKPGFPADASIQDTFKAQANILLRSLGSGSVENGYRHVESDALARYPSADKLMLWREYIYVSCTLLSASSQWNDDQKWDKWMQLMNRWNAAPADTAVAPAAGTGTRVAPPGTFSPRIGGIALGTSISELQDRKDVALSLDKDGNTYGEETFTFFYGAEPGARPLDGDVVFWVANSEVASITVTHTLNGAGCADNGLVGLILNQAIRNLGTPLRRTVSDVRDSGTTSYTFKGGSTDMALVFQTFKNDAGALGCKVSMNYQSSGSS